MSDTIKDFPQPESNEQKQERIIKHRTQALDNLTKVANGNYNLSLDKALVEIYEYSEADIKLQSETSKQQLIRAEVATDVLYRELYEENGEPSEYARQNSLENIDPNEYQVLGSGWESAKATLKKKVPEPSSKNEGDSYSGNILTKVENNTADENSSDPVERYAAKFGPDSILALPFSIQVSKNDINVKYVPDFQAPYGGKDFIERLVYTKVIG